MAAFQHSTGTFIGKGGIEIFFQQWEVANPKAVLVIIHGLGEHSGRYGNLIDALQTKGIAIFGLDHRGFGRSGGKRGHVDSFMDYIYDMKIFVNMIRDKHPNKPVIMLGHSMGGVLALKYALTHAEDLDALILSSPGLVPAIKVPAWKKNLAIFLSSRIPSLTMPSGLDATTISRDKEVVKQYLDDPLVHDKVTPRFYVEMMNTIDECINRCGEIKLPLLLFHGTADALVLDEASKIVYQKASSKDKTLKLFEGLYHETMNELEPDRKKVLKVVADWIVAHAKKTTTTKPKAASKPVKKAAPKKAKPKKVIKSKPKTSKKAKKK
ncbi:MAG: alpha/beta hydrolase [Spirochaetota bacterium]|nr:alpha/beta hydrolase [Spirochaetota bacterium]